MPFENLRTYRDFFLRLRFFYLFSVFIYEARLNALLHDDKSEFSLIKLPECLVSRLQG